MITAKAKINPSLLTWARKESGHTVESLALKVDTKPEKLLDWEKGGSLPSMSQVRKLANCLRRPPAIFFLATPPPSENKPKDFRKNRSDNQFLPEALFMFRWAESRRETAAELAKELDVKPFSSYPSATHISNPISPIADTLRFLDFNREYQYKNQKPEEFLKYCISLLESKDILVFQTENINLSQFRGFSIPALPFPVIAINSEDSYHGRIFTLFHELGHILLREGGICDLEFEDKTPKNDTDKIEIWCNQFSANLLCPSEEIYNFIQENYDPKTKIQIKQIEELSKHFIVSREVIARRVFQLRLISENEYKKFRREFQKDWIKYKNARKEKKGGGGVNTHLYTNLNRNGRKYSSIVLSAYNNNLLNPLQAGQFLNIRTQYLNSLSGIVFGS
ncbi:ImmA/IrrE family metallo-endopeptidase [Leptospira wolffii]|uniref:ImmA/IrrE family metallo-endopeptidase n=1 Tax=Leptospira wolffii TaxID=409998 RepID=UPI0003069415|nr:XRE family transcriptional regulator [Leptospira wolffii]EPG65786.1 PF06114 domain protein [Leptospira wolffii serovar Khorat str. Khorat-H2]